MFLKRPRFEVLAFPASELEWWSLYFSIEDNGDKPIEPELTEKQKVKQNIQRGRELLGG